ncbi:hypothetical protein [Sphingobacterium thalpophilum]|uniref:hypothetical protein n=1 Tax=Sphingobacterium thalpophilum TaxID=259 RepID=UPI002D797084|nr:hypothetical protein [Sphingobacterium thalpophilum]
MALENLILNHKEEDENKIIFIYGSNDIPQIVMAEGDLANGELGFVIKILELEYLNQGLGFQVFNLIVDHFGLVNINTICGSWHADDEFAHFENGMSTNLLIYKRSLENFSREEAAFLTPTGKWVKRLGFNHVSFIEDNASSVVVKFRR